MEFQVGVDIDVGVSGYVDDDVESEVADYDVVEVGVGVGLHADVCCGGDIDVDDDGDVHVDIGVCTDGKWLC